MDFLKNLFGKQEEDEQEDLAPVVAPQPVPIDPTVKDYLTKKQAAPESTADKYLEAMNNNAEVEGAQKDVRWNRVVQGLLGAANTAWGTGNNESFNSRIKTSEQDVRDAEARKQKKADNILMSGKLGREDIMNEREDKDWQFKDGERDRNAKAANSMKLLIQSKHKIPAEQLTDMNYDQLKDIYSRLSTDQNQARDNSNPIIRSIRNAEGNSTFHVYDKDQRDFVDMGKQVAHAPKVSKDPITGELLLIHSDGAQRKLGATSPGGANPQASSNVIQMLPGETPASYKVRLEAASTGLNKAATIGAVTQDELDTAEVRLTKREGLNKKYMDMYTAADKEGGVGPVSGRVSGVKNTLGISSGKNTDGLRRELEDDLLTYIAELSGKTVTDQERKFVRDISPQMGQDRALFETSLAAAFTKAEKHANEQRGVRAKQTGGAAQPTQSAQVPAAVKAPAYTTEQRNLIEKYKGIFANQDEAWVIEGLQSTGRWPK